MKRALVDRRDYSPELPIKALLLEVASMCEGAYRRGAQHAIAMELSEEDGAWYRNYGRNRGMFLNAHRMPRPCVKDGKRMSPRYYSRHGGGTALDRLFMELHDNHKLLAGLARDLEACESAKIEAKRMELR
jgi:hypothetical protein